MGVAHFSKFIYEQCDEMTYGDFANLVSHPADAVHRPCFRFVVVRSLASEVHGSRNGHTHIQKSIELFQGGEAFVAPRVLFEFCTSKFGP